MSKHIPTGRPPGRPRQRLGPTRRTVLDLDYDQVDRVWDAIRLLQGQGKRIGGFVGFVSIAIEHELERVVPKHLVADDLKPREDQTWSREELAERIGSLASGRTDLPIDSVPLDLRDRRGPQEASGERAIEQGTEAAQEPQPKSPAEMSIEEIMGWSPSKTEGETEGQK